MPWPSFPGIFQVIDVLALVMRSCLTWSHDAFVSQHRKTKTKTIEYRQQPHQLGKASPQSLESEWSPPASGKRWRRQIRAVGNASKHGPERAAGPVGRSGVGGDTVSRFVWRSCNGFPVQLRMMAPSIREATRTPLVETARRESVLPMHAGLLVAGLAQIGEEQGR